MPKKPASGVDSCVINQSIKPASCVAIEPSSERFYNLGEAIIDPIQIPITEGQAVTLRSDSLAQPICISGSVSTSQKTPPALLPSPNASSPSDRSPYPFTEGESDTTVSLQAPPRSARGGGVRQALGGAGQGGAAE